MVLNDIIEQAAGRQSRGSEKAGMRQTKWFTLLFLLSLSLLNVYNNNNNVITYVLCLCRTRRVCDSAISAPRKKKKRCINKSLLSPCIDLHDKICAHTLYLCRHD